MLEVDSISKKYDGVKAIENISFRVDRGHVYGLIGENGVGKTTLIKCLSGIYRPDSGTCVHICN